MKALTDVDKTRVQNWGETLEATITLRYATTGHDQDDALRAFVEQLAAWAPPLRPKRDPDARVGLPTIFVGSRVAYQALPSDRELEPFLSALGDPLLFGDRLSMDVRRRLAELQAPALLKVYITPSCPFCPVTVSLLLGVAAASDHVRLTVIDGVRFPEAAEADRIGSAPTVILDDQFRWTGSVDPGELVALMLDRDPAELGTEALRGLIEAGDADDVARMMIDRGLLFPAFFDLLVHPRWSVRLGTMVVFETLVEQDPELAHGVVEPLVARFSDADASVRGDLLHVLGEAGNPAALPFLESVAADTDDGEVREAAQEAIEKLTDA